jgi:hypothetical protein
MSRNALVRGSGALCSEMDTYDYRRMYSATLTLHCVKIAANYMIKNTHSYYRHVTVSILTAGSHCSIVGVTTTKIRFYVFDIHNFTFYKEIFLNIQHLHSAVVYCNTNYSVI